MGASWYGTRYRKLFFDFHSPGSTVGLAAAFDAERWADRVRATGAQAISVCTKCGYGYSFYQKGHVRYQHPIYRLGSICWRSRLWPSTGAGFV